MTIPLIVLAVGLAMLLIERRKRARDWPVVVGWWPRAIAANAVQAGLAFITGVAWDGWMLRHRPWTLENQGVLTQAALSYLVITFVYYWWHRWRHEWPFLWRWLHQFHHSPQRIELLTSFYKHPFEIALNALLSSAIIYLVVGAEPLAASIAVTMTGLAEFVYHWNIATPHWLGYVIQRPESHCVHHEEGLHHFNYADLPLWDMLFGTFRNPTQWNGRCGFGDNQEQRITELLMGREIGMAISSDGAP